MIHIAIISKISVDIAECSSITHNDESSEKNNNDRNRNERSSIT